MLNITFDHSNKYHSIYFMIQSFACLFVCWLIIIMMMMVIVIKRGSDHAVEFLNQTGLVQLH